MRVAVLSDIHGNLAALDAVLAHRIGRRRLAPRRRRRLRPRARRRRRAPRRDRRGRRPRQPRRGGDRRRRDRLVQPRRARGDGVDPAGDRRRRRGTGWRPCPSATIDGGFRLVHGSPREPIWEYIMSVPVARANLAPHDDARAVRPHPRADGLLRRSTAGCAAVEQTSRPRLALGGAPAPINPGSVGQPRDGDPRRATWSSTPTPGRTWHRVAVRHRGGPGGDESGRACPARSSTASRTACEPAA